MKKISFYKQHDEMDCGPTCLKIILNYYGKNVSSSYINQLSNTNKLGTSLKSISNVAEKIGFKTLGVILDFDKLKDKAPLPLIVYWKQKHFVVVYKIKKNKIYVADPSIGKVVYTKTEFLKGWYESSVSNEGIALLFEPTEALNSFESELTNNKKGFSFLYNYVKKYNRVVSHKVCKPIKSYSE